MKGNGKIIFLMDQVRHSISMVPGTSANFLIIRSMVKELCIKVITFIVEILKMIISMVNLGMKDKMDKLTMEIGNKMKSMDMVYILGLTEVDMKDIILMERGKGKGK
jgi:hypothetical protein